MRRDNVGLELGAGGLQREDLQVEWGSHHWDGMVGGMQVMVRKEQLPTAQRTMVQRLTGMQMAELPVAELLVAELLVTELAMVELAMAELA